MTTTANASSSPMPDTHAHANQFALLGQRRFAPFFWTQFSGAANDNLFKFALTVMVTYQLSVSWLPSAMAGAVTGGVVLLAVLALFGPPLPLAVKTDQTRPLLLMQQLEIVL